MANLLYVPSQNGIQKTLGAQLLSGVTAAATLNNVTGIQNKAGVFVVDRVDTNNVETPTKREYVKFSGTSGSTVVTLTRNVDGSGTDQDHAIGAIVEFVPDVVWAQALNDVILVEHGDNGVHSSALVTTLKATGAVVDTGTSDLTIVTPKAIADSAVTTASKTQTLTNKRITKRIVTATDDATAVIDVDVTDQYQLTAIANDTTVSTTGTPTAGQTLIIRLKDAGVSKNLTWDAVFNAVGVTLPTATTAGKTHYIGCIYNATSSKFDAVATAVEA